MAEQTLPITIEDITEEKMSKLRARGHAGEEKLVTVKPGAMVLPERYRRLAHAYLTFQFWSDDTVVMTYPKSGTTWCMEILWAMRNPERLHLAYLNRIHDRTYFMQRDIMRPNRPGDGSQTYQRFVKECPGGLPEDGVLLQLAAVHKGSPRIFSTHLPFALQTPSLLDTCKVVYIARNPKDVCLSYYNHFRKIKSMTGGLRDFAELFMAGEFLHGPYWSHLQQAWCRRGHPNIHFMFYEDMKADLMVELRRLRDFLQIDLSEDQLVSVADHVTLEKMKEREKVQPFPPFRNQSFFNEGRVGSWAAAAPPDLDARMDQWIKESQCIDVAFKYQ